MRQRILVTSARIALAAGVLFPCGIGSAQQLVPVSPATRTGSSFSIDTDSTFDQTGPAFTSPRGNKVTATPHNNEFSSPTSQSPLVDTGDPYAPSPNKFPTTPPTSIPDSVSIGNPPVFFGQKQSVPENQTPVEMKAQTFQPPQPAIGNSVGQWQQVSPSGQIKTLSPPSPPPGGRPLTNTNQFRPIQTDIAVDSNANPATTINKPVKTSRNPIDPGGLLSTTLPTSTNGIETILQRFPDGKIEIARQVTQDAQGNYVNHGIWKRFQENGQLISAGTYQMGQRSGTWFRWHYVSEAPLLHEAPYTEFKGPFLSKAVFHNDQLNGPWTIYDQQQRTASVIQLRNGARHGAAIWNFANGQKYREIMYEDGKIDGHFREWNKQARPTRQVIFQKGRPMLREISWIDRERGIKEFEANYLGGEVTIESPDNWNELQLATYTVKGEQQKHGSETVWYPNGQMMMKGQHEYGQPVGQFVWWHENGQKQLAGEYDDGAQSAQWTWWHENGLKSIQGQYANNETVGQWTWWDPTGEIARSRNFSIDQIDESERRESLADGDQSLPEASGDTGVPLLRARQISNKSD